MQRKTVRLLGIDNSSDDYYYSENNTLGSLGFTMALATLGAVIYASSNRDEE